MLKRNGMWLLVPALAASSLLPVRADDEASRLQALMTQRAPSVCSVKAVLKVRSAAAGGGEDESRLQLQGVVVTADGLVMLSNRGFSPRGMMASIGEGPDTGIQMTPADFKVTFEQDDREYSGFLAATDTKLGLAFVQVQDLAGRKLTPVDFNSTATPNLGDPVISVSRLMKGYDFAPYYEMGRVSGEISKPRKAWLLDGGLSGLGLPVYALNGDVIGVLTTVQPGVSDDSDAASMGFAMFVKMLTGGGGSGIRTFIVPTTSVEAVITAAQKKSVEIAADRAKNKPAAPASPAKAAPSGAVNR